MFFISFELIFSKISFETSWSLSNEEINPINKSNSITGIFFHQIQDKIISRFF